MIICHHDYTSPAAAVAVLRLERLVAEGASVAFRGIDVLGLGVPVPPTQDLLRELERCRDQLADLGLEPRRPAMQPPTLDAHLVGALAATRGLGSPWRLGAYRAYWERGADLADREVLLELAGDTGLGRDRAAAELADPGGRTALRQAMSARRRAGIGGVPVLEVNGALVDAPLDDADLRRLAGIA